MAHSIQAYRKRLLTLNDRSLLALVALLRRLDRSRTDPRLSELTGRWLRAVEAAGPGTVDLDFDATLIGENDVDRLVGALREIAREVRAYGERVPAAVLNGAALPTGIVFSDFPSRDLIACTQALETFLRGSDPGEPHP